MWPKQKIIDELDVDEFKWLYQKMKEIIPYEKWYSIESQCNGILGKKDLANGEIESVNLILGRLKSFAKENYDQHLTNIRSFTVTIELPKGEQLTLAIAPFQTVIALKERIHMNSGIPVDKQMLFNGNSELVNDKTLDGHLVISGSRFYLMVRGDGFEIFIQGVVSKCYTLRNLTPNTTVREVKDRIFEKERIDPNEQMLKCQQYSLQDDRTIGSYNIRQGSTVSVGVRTRGGLNE